jgi:hypothetical protein
MGQNDVIGKTKKTVALEMPCKNGKEGNSHHSSHGGSSSLLLWMGCWCLVLQTVVVGRDMESGMYRTEQCN